MLAIVRGPRPVQEGPERAFVRLPGGFVLGAPRAAQRGRSGFNSVGFGWVLSFFSLI